MTVSLDIAEKRRLLLEKLLRKQEGAYAEEERIPRRTGGGPAPLSFGQQRLWFLYRLAPESAAYNLAEAVRLRDPLDVWALERALSAVAGRHEALRTVFPTDPDGEPTQVVLAPSTSPLACADLSGLPQAVRAPEAARLAAELAGLPFVLEEGPPLRSTLLRLGADDHVVVLVVHHIVADGWSLRVLVRDLSHLYRAFTTGGGVPLPALPVQYADFAAWQHGRLQGKRLEEVLRRALERLSGAPTVLELPTDRPHPPVQSFRGSHETVRVPPAAAAALLETGRSQGATLYMVLLTAFAVLLHRHTGQEDLLIGSPAAGRSLPELEDLIGFFANTLVLRAELSGDPAFPVLLSRLRRSVLEAEELQELPFERLVDASEVQRDLSRSPLFQAMLAFQAAMPEASGSPVGMEAFAIDARRAQFDLHLSLGGGDRGMSGSLVYRTDLFDRATGRRMARQFETLLGEIARRPDRRISDLPVLSAAESRQLLAEWNDTRTSRSEGICLPDLIAAQAARTPGSEAVVFDGPERQSLTFAELHDRASRLALHLRSLGCGPETRVGVAMERSLEMMVALVGVLAAGAAYVPLDPEYPRERLAAMLDDARPAALLTEERLLPLLPAHGLPVLCLDAEAPLDAAGELPDGKLDDLSLAYVIFTSGSTGRPKGAMVHHRAIVNRLLWMQEVYELTAEDTVLQKTPVSFDVSVWELFWPLFTGARLVLARPGGHRDPAYLVDLIGREQVSVLHFVPPMLQLFLEEPDLSPCRSLRLVVASGEALPAGLERRFAERLEAALHNLYGPTEAAVDVTSWECGRGGDVHRPIPIGRPIANVRIHLLDRQGSPVPIGAPGELFIGGVNVGRGYLARPDLTAERFVPDPFADEPGARLYRTGDLARHRPDGAVEFLGRLDHQVKIRGFRIELGEIEAVLTSHPAVREAAVIAREDAGGRRLVGYLIPSAEPLDLAELRRFLAERLPDYMVPGSLLLLESFPLSPNGKLDRKALPAPEVLPVADDAFVPPQGPTEELVAAIWADLLVREQIGARDSFFDLGGHSLMAARVTSRVRSLLGVELPLRALFEDPTVSTLARRIERERARGAATELPPLRPQPRSGDLPLSFAQQRLWFLDQMQPGSPLYNIPRSVRLAGPLDARALAASLGRIVARHEALRTTFPLDGDQPAQRIAAPGPWTLPLVDLDDLPEDCRPAAAHQLAAEEARRPFDLARGPLLRATLLRLGASEHVLLLTLHHIVADGWSLGVLTREIAALYPPLAAGRPATLPPLPLQYPDFSVWQRSWLQGELLEREIAFWREQLDGAPTLLELPADRPRPPVAAFRGALRERLLAPQLGRAVRALARREGATSFMALLATFGTLLGRYAGTTDLVVASSVANRDREEIEGLIGLFVNTLALRVRTPETESFAGVLALVRETTLAAFAHQDLPFEKLIDALGLPRELSSNPLCQVMLTYQNLPPAGGQIPGLETTSLATRAIETGTAKFDLTLLVWEDQERLGTLLQFNTDLFEAPTAERILGHLEVLLAGAAADPQARIAEMPLLTTAELHQLVEGWNDTATEWEDDACLHALFREQVRRTPENLAAVFESESLTYAELDRRSNRLAHHLRAQGVEPETRVALCFARSLEMVVALLAVLKAGGTYVPLDPNAPADRLADLLDDLRRDGVPPPLLTQAALAARFAAYGGPVLRLDADWERLEGEESKPPESGVTPAHAAYVLYTSGSTGRPKGVVVEHRQIVNYLRSVEIRLGLKPGESAAMLQPLSVDSSKTALYPPLLSGGTLHLISDERALDAEKLAEYFRRHAIGMLKIAPSHLIALQTSSAAAEDVLPRGWLVLGGEASRLDWVLGLATGEKGCRVFIHYGPTEATVGMLAGRIEPGLAAGHSGTAPLGRPFAGTRVYLLDRGMQPVPLGIPGELYIGGACVARGYDGRPHLTAERFVPDPFAATPGDRLYRTGDLARFLPDARIEFLGRFDHQVKIRGFRIELGEIESTLSRHPGVREAVVVAREEAGGTKRLVAYLLARGETPPDLAGLQSWAKEKLPGYMVPSAFIWLTDFPRSAHGKLDRKRLPAPEPAVRTASYEAPQSPAEEKLAQVWRQVLRVERVGLQDNFFELGGDSILCIQVIARAAAAGLRLTARQVFEHPTVAGLAAVAEEAADKPAAVGWSAAPAPLTPIQRRFFEQELVHPEHYNQAVLLSAAHLDGELLGRALASLLAHHEALCVRFERQGSWRQVHRGRASGSPLLRIDLAALPPERRREGLEQAASRLQTSLDLSAGPLLRAALFHFGSGQPCRLLLAIHHLVVDGVSWRILLEDLETVYRQLASGEAVSLPPRTTSYQSWAERLAAYAGSPELAAQASFWSAEHRLATPLPLRAVAPGTAAEAVRVAVALDAAATRALLQGVPQAYRTQINDALLTALVESFASWTGSRRLLVDLEGHGRGLFPDLDLSRTVGWFTSVHPVGLDTTEASGPGAALCAVKEQLRSAPGQGIGYGVLRYLGEGEAADALRALPRAQVLFNYLGQLDQALPAASLFQAAAESAGETREPRQRRLYPVEINGGVEGGRLHLAWTCDAADRDAVQAWAGRFLEALRELIEHCLSPEAGGFTPSDFPLARVRPAELDRLAAEAHGGIEDLYPVSPVQEGMLFHSLQAPGSGVYVEQLGLRVQAGFDIAAFEHAWEQLVRRHPVLRTTFHWLGLERPLQIVHAEVAPPWTRHDLRQLSAAEQREWVARFLREDRRQGFDLGHPPLLRLTLLRLREHEHHFVWSHHHILTDGWSTSILLNELLSLYEARSRGAEASLGRVRPYRDFIAWLVERDASAAEAFWRQSLQGIEEPTTLDLAGHPAAGEAARGERSSSLPAAATASLRRFCRTHQLTLATAVQGAWALLLARYRGSGDVLFGAVTSGRSAPLTGIESMVGLFINTLPVRVRVPGGAELVAWLRGLQESQAEMRQHESSQLTEIQGWSEIPRGTPLFESILVIENQPIDDHLEERMARSLQITDAEVAEQTNYPLSLDVSPGSRLGVKALYDGGRFDPVSIDRLLGHLKTLLAGMAAGAGARLDAFSLLSAGERHQVLAEWNDSGASLPEGGFVELFAARAAAAPDAVAAVCGEDRLTYRELADRSERLAQALAGLGVGPESRVALLAERGLYFLTAVLAIFRAGGAYLPLDPHHPQQRHASLLADSGAELVLTDRALEELLDREPVRAIPMPGTAPDRLAYVIYTSGSTGAPKGAMVEQGGMLNHLWAKVWDLRLGPGDAVAQTASQCFDISVWQLLAALLAGGRVHILPDEVAHHPERLLAEVERHGITVLETVPSLLRLALEELERQGPARPALDRLRWLIPTGEALPPELCRQWLHLYPGVPLLNAYGPTECSDDVTHHPIRRGEEPLRAPTPIGRPVSNTRLYVLDRGMAPLPAGVAGELFVGGAGVGRGYLGDGARTARAFLPDPFAGRLGARLYRTGDLARWRADGRLEFLGRVDHQVKIRGFRIEPGEIEAALALHPGVRECAVVAREEREGDRRLIAYLVPEAEPPAAAVLRDFLRTRLPEPLMPSAFVTLPALPLTANGKLDRRALPAPDSEPERGASAEERPPRPVEEVVAGVWAELLGRDHVGLRQSFFDLGGHSLLATRVISALRRSFGIDLPLRALFDAPTVSELAEVIEAALRSGSGLAVPPLEPAPRRPGTPEPLSFAQQRLWFLSRLSPESSAYNVPAAVRLKGPLEVRALAASLDEIVRRHAALRTTFQEIRDEPVQVIAPAAPVLLPVTDLRALPDESREAEARRLAREAVRRPFDLTRGPLLRIALLRLADGEHLAVFAIHHIVSDGWSMGVLVREVAALYTALVRGQGSPLPELPVQYADFARWQRHWLQGEALERSLGFWTRRLAGAPPLLELPGAWPRPAQPTGRGAERSRLLPLDLALAIQALGRRESATLFMTLLAAFQTVLYARTGVSDLVVGTDVAGRDRAETEGLIGFFINQLALRGDLSGNPTFRELLARVRESLLEAYTYQDLPFDRLVEALGAGRDLRHAPVFQVKLILQNVPRAELSLPGLTLETFDLETATAQIDLNLRATETGSGLYFSLAFSTEIYDAGTIERLLEQLEILLRSVAERPETRLRDLIAEISEADRSLRAERDRELREASREKLLTLRRRPASGAGA